MKVNNEIVSARSDVISPPRSVSPRNETRRHMLDLEDEVRQLQVDISNERHCVVGLREDYRRVSDIALRSRQLCVHLRKQQLCCRQELGALREQHWADTRIMSMMLLKALHERADILAMAKSVLEHSDNASKSSSALPQEQGAELVRLAHDVLGDEKVSPSNLGAQSPWRSSPSPARVAPQDSVTHLQSSLHSRSPTVLSAPAPSSFSVSRPSTNDSLARDFSNPPWDTDTHISTAMDERVFPPPVARESTRNVNGDQTSGDNRGANATRMARQHGRSEESVNAALGARVNVVHGHGGSPSTTNVRVTWAGFRDTPCDSAPRIADNSRRTTPGTGPAAHADASPSDGVFSYVQPSIGFKGDQSAAALSRNNATQRQSSTAQKPPPSISAQSDDQSAYEAVAAGTILEDAAPRRTVGSNFMDVPDADGTQDRASAGTIFELDDYPTVVGPNSTILLGSIFSNDVERDTVTDSVLMTDQQQYTDAASSGRHNTVMFDTKGNTISDGRFTLSESGSVGDPRVSASSARQSDISFTSLPVVPSGVTTSSLGACTEDLVSRCMRAATTTCISTGESLSAGTLELIVVAVVSQVANTSTADADVKGSITTTTPALLPGVMARSVEGTQSARTTEVEDKEVEHQTWTTSNRDATRATVERHRSTIEGMDCAQLRVDRKSSRSAQHERPSVRVGDDIYYANRMLAAPATKEHVPADNPTSPTKTNDSTTHVVADQTPSTCIDGSVVYTGSPTTVDAGGDPSIDDPINSRHTNSWHDVGAAAAATPGASRVDTVGALPATHRPPHSNGSISSGDKHSGTSNQPDELLTPHMASWDPAIVHAISKLLVQQQLDTRRLHPCSPADSSTPHGPTEVTSSTRTGGALYEPSNVGHYITRVSDTQLNADEEDDNARFGDNLPPVPRFNGVPDLRDVGPGSNGHGNANEVLRARATAKPHPQYIDNHATRTASPPPINRSSDEQQVRERASSLTYAKLPLDPQPATQSNPFAAISRATWPQQELVLPTLSAIPVSTRRHSIAHDDTAARNTVHRLPAKYSNPTHTPATSLDFVPPASLGSVKYDSVKHSSRDAMSASTVAPSHRGASETTGYLGPDSYTPMNMNAMSPVWVKEHGRPQTSSMAMAARGVNPPNLGGASDGVGEGKWQPTDIFLLRPDLPAAINMS